MYGPKVIETLTDNRVIVNTRGLRRVVIQPSGRVIGELLSVTAAAVLCGSFNRCGCESKAVAVPYRPAVVPFKSASAAKAKFRSA
jgi:hypothetical protein